MAEQAPAVSPGWRKSSYSANGGTACVETGHIPGAVLVRDTTQQGAGPVLHVSPAGWRRFVAEIS